MVGLSSGNSHSHNLQTTVLLYSKIQGEGSAKLSSILCEKNSSAYQEEAFIQKVGGISFKET